MTMPQVFATVSIMAQVQMAISQSSTQFPTFPTSCSSRSSTLAFVSPRPPHHQRHPRHAAIEIQPIQPIKSIQPSQPSSLHAPAQSQPSQSSRISRIVLRAASKSASKTKKKNGGKSSSGGGFGSSPSSPSSSSSSSSRKGKKTNQGKKGNQDKDTKDTIIYPELEPQVRQTLIGADGSNAANGALNEDSGSILSEEMYDRLEEIYGLEKFNFGGEGAIYTSIGVDAVDAMNTVDDADDGASSPVEAAGSILEDIFSSGGTGIKGNSALDELLAPSSPSSSSTIDLSSFSSASSTSTTASSASSTNDSNEKGREGTDSTDSTASFDLNKLQPFSKFRVLHTDPMVLAIDDFFTMEECDRYVQISMESETRGKVGNNDNGEKSERSESTEGSENSGIENDLEPMLLGQSQTVGKDSRSQAQRTSTTWFHHYRGVPELMAKASRLMGLNGIERWEEPQTVRYRRNEKFTWHLDALSPEEATNPSGAGQRVATLLVYLTDLPSGSGGATMFRDLGGGDGSLPLKVRPKKGSALLFFPAAGGIPNAPFDIRTLHCGEAVAKDAENEKWIAQLWLRQREYRPTAPLGNVHGDALSAIGEYCDYLAK